MLADVAEEIEERERGRPVRIVHQPGRVGEGRGEIEETAELYLDGCDIMSDLIIGEEIALVGLAGWVPHHAGGAPGQGDRAMSS